MITKIVNKKLNNRNLLRTFLSIFFSIYFFNLPIYLFFEANAVEKFPLAIVECFILVPSFLSQNILTVPKFNTNLLTPKFLILCSLLTKASYSYIIISNIKLSAKLSY